MTKTNKKQQNINPGYEAQAKKLAKALGLPGKSQSYIKDHEKNTKAMLDQVKRKNKDAKN